MSLEIVARETEGQIMFVQRITRFVGHMIKSLILSLLRKKGHILAKFLIKLFR